ncbi:hypothetical protein FFLO_05230 [Filobasidium floriforme]|uniref:Uncharacterized protein n=1 Tax=Filobasidium floriforme TaxID=5210 RepID=A0A8K0JHE4_9TREE|nr:uncharacterized protein HD553DRAFT_322745 [Filobasidium floriforme]KAG7530182.1 hypothetical protein FFLO_05230 [Filobasidium floriforme]KAH8087236.1 hypothetical protein HD553DRAFT_322745 [Filobasidium floriforme]
MTTDNTEIVHVSGKETERIGTEAFVFIELKGWENVALGVDGDPLHRWYDQVAKRVWSSFTCAGHNIKKATFIVVYNKDLWEHSISSYNLPGDVLVCQSGFFTVQTWIEKNLPVQKPIVIAIVHDTDMLPAAPFTQLGEKTNLLAAHYLRYAMPTSKVQSVWKPWLVESAVVEFLSCKISSEYFLRSQHPASSFGLLSLSCSRIYEPVAIDGQLTGDVRCRSPIKPPRSVRNPWIFFSAGVNDEVFLKVSCLVAYAISTKNFRIACPRRYVHMSQDSDTKTAVTIVDVSGIDVDRVGTEAFVFIHLKGWQEGYVVFSPDGTIRQWFYEVSRRVWSSFSVAGDPIKKATFIVHYDTFWELYCSGWEAPGDVIVTGKDERSAEAWAENERHSIAFPLVRAARLI